MLQDNIFAFSSKSELVRMKLATELESADKAEPLFSIKIDENLQVQLNLKTCLPFCRMADSNFEFLTFFKDHFWPIFWDRRRVCRKPGKII